MKPSGDVIFELDGPALLVRLHAEMRRLGHTRQSFSRTDEGPFYLRVADPPAFTLRRAADGTPGVRAYLAHGPRLFIDINNHHVLIRSLRPSRGTLTLIAADGSRADLSERAFVATDALADMPVSSPPALADVPARGRVPVAPRLTRATTPADASAWVLTDAELGAFARDADERLVERLDFARRGGAVLLRARPSREGTPVVEPGGVALAPLLKLDVLAPPGTRLSPPLRRDVTRACFGDDAGRLILLRPGDPLRVETVAASHLRPLADAIEYRVEGSPRALSFWHEPDLFTPEPFAEREEGVKPKKPRRREDVGDQSVEVPFGSTQLNVTITPGKAPPATLPSLDALAAEGVEKPTTPQATRELQDRLATLERQFLAADGPIDGPAHRALWPPMGHVNAALGNDAEAALCWSNALWHDHSDRTLVRSWRRSEQDVPLKALLSRPGPSLAELRAVVAWVVEAAATGTGATLPLGESARFLERFEDRLPVRVAWLGWVALASLAGGDVLALTRARDRLLRQLHESGLNPDRDLPRFLRVSRAGAAATDQHLDTPRLRQMHAKATAWGGADWADPVFAYGFARFGDAGSAREVLKRVKPTDDPRTTTQWAHAAYAERVRGLLDGKRPGWPLSEELIRALDRFDRYGGSDRRWLERFRKASVIVEPFDRGDPTRSLDQDLELALLKDTPDANRIAVFRRLLKTSPAPVRQLRILATAVPLAFRSPYTFAIALLDAIKPVQGGFTGFVDLHDLFAWVWLLESALALAAHHDRPAYLPDVLARLGDLMKPLNAARAGWLVREMGGGNFRLLSRLGLRKEAKSLLDRMSDTVLEGKGVRKMLTRPGLNRAVMLPALMRLAGGWFYFGEEKPAREAVEAARAELYDPATSAATRVPLAVAYAGCLGNAPVSLALPCLDELFDRLPPGSTIAADYAIDRVRVIEAAVTSLAAEDFSLDAEARRILDEEEFLIRRRVHADVRESMSRAGV